jgi:hypothetical protein
MADTPKKADTSEYSASKAPETRKEAENREPQNFADWRLIPGGKHGSPEPSGMNALHRGDVPSGADRPGLTKFDDVLE